MESTGVGDPTGAAPSNREPLRATAQLPASLASSRMAREMVREVTGLPENARLALIVTELVTNAVNHAKAAPVFTVWRDGSTVRVEVHDDGPGHPVVRQVDATATSGRGMALVDTVADAWGIEATASGKTVWAEVRLASDLGD